MCVRLRAAGLYRLDTVEERERESACFTIEVAVGAHALYDILSGLLNRCGRKLGFFLSSLACAKGS